MLVALYISRAALGWGIVVLRWPLFGRAGTPRAFWVCMLSCAVGATLQIPFVYQQLVLFLGDDRYASVLLLSAGVAAAVGYVPYWLPSAAGLPAPLDGDWFAGAVACAVSSCALIGGHPSTSYVCVGTCGFVDATWRSWLHWLPVLGVYAWTMLERVCSATATERLATSRRCARGYGWSVRGAPFASVGLACAWRCSSPGTKAAYRRHGGRWTAGPRH